MPDHGLVPVGRIVADFEPATLIHPRIVGALNFMTWFSGRSRRLKSDSACPQIAGMIFPRPSMLSDRPADGHGLCRLL